MEIVNHQQGSQEWLDWRRLGISATDSCIILNQSPYKTAWLLWQEKTGRFVPADLSNNPYVRFGKENEDKARNLFISTHNEMVIPYCAESSQDPIFRCSFDGLTSNDEPVEIKCPQEATLSDVKARGKDSDAYKLYNIQVQHQLLVSEASKGWLVFLDGEQLIEFEIERDEDLIQRILQEGKRFYEMIVSDTEPPIDPERDIYIPKGADVHKWLEAVSDYREIQTLLEELKVRQDELLATLERPKKVFQLLMGEHQRADFGGLSVTQSFRRGSIDYKQIISDLNLADHSIDFESYRRKGSQQLRITLHADGNEMPSRSVDEDLLKTLKETTVNASLYF